MSPQFFIGRPKFAMVVAIVTVLAGLLALLAIPVEQFPNIVPPQVVVGAIYPGASTEDLVNSVAAPIEAQVNGVDNMLYMESTNADSGSYTLTVTFAVGTDPDIDAINVQNRVTLATPRLPSTVTAQGITVRKRSSNMLLLINLYSPKGTRDPIFVSNYASINVRDALARVPGVGDTNVLGALDYAIRVWMNPNRMHVLGITAGDLISAIQQQNIQAAAGQIGAPPTGPDQQQQLTVIAHGRLQTPEEFANIIVRTNLDGGIVRVKDVARVELGAQTYSASSALDGKRAVSIAIYLSPGANALNVAKAVRAQLATLERRFPDDIAQTVIFDTTRFVTATIREIVMTLGITFVLVVLVVYIFLQDWRSTLIPMLTIPVSLIGVFAILLALGYSANTVTLFALVLAITLVVDDSIVVVENVQRVMEENSELSTVEATRRAMGQITGPVIATTLVLAAVFVPVTFLPGISGQLYRQFAVTIALSVLISAINALSLSPALCALLLRRPRLTQSGPMGAFNRLFERARTRYGEIVGWLARRLRLVVATLILVALAVYGAFMVVPRGFLPDEDQGYFFVNIQLPDAASLVRTQAVLDEVRGLIGRTEGVAHIITIAGFSLLSGSGLSNGATAIVVLKPWSQRSDAGQTVFAILARLNGEVAAIPSASIIAFNAPPIPGIGNTAGFDLRLQAVNGQSPQELASVMRGFITKANQDPSLSRVFSTFSAAVPQIFVEADRTKAELLGVPVAQIFVTLQAHLGGQYVNDFNLLSRVFQVQVQDDTGFRERVDQIDQLYVRSNVGSMVPLRSLVSLSTTLGPQTLNRYNLFPTVTINGSPAPGRSTGEALDAMDRLAQTSLPNGYATEWSGISYQERQVGGQAAAIFALAVLFAYLFLVAQYESWSVPMSVLLSVIFAVAGAAAALAIAHLANNIYAQIGLVLLVGLAAKNAILIVEFAREQHEAGMEVVAAAVTGGRQRFRAVLMTAFAFILGVVPLVIAAGAGAASRRAIGTAVWGGMLAATFVGIFFIPALYVLFQSLRERFHRRVEHSFSAQSAQNQGRAAGEGSQIGGKLSGS
ncbi:MAG: hydrophobe/amphiphile efflux family transporter [Rhodospirillales bacterium]|nr:hydrophobe/amphiphile efflux family transporter [Rhodospirillales bacterium]